MSSAVTESASYAASITGPDGTDPRTAASVRTPLGQLASRSKWLKESFVYAETKTITISGDDYPSGTSYATVTGSGGVGTASFTLTVAVGDIVEMGVSAGIQPTTSSAFEYGFRLYDGSNVLAEDSRGESTWSTDHIDALDIRGMRVVTSAGSTTFSLQGKTSNSGRTFAGATDLRVWIKHTKKGA